MCSKCSDCSKCINQTETCLDWFGYIARLKDTTKKVVISSEGFAFLTGTQLGQLASDLSKLTTRIVMVYRPFYSYIASFYRQGVSLNISSTGFYRQRAFKENISSTGFADWLSDEIMDFYAYNLFTTAVYSRYAVYFSDIRVHTLSPSIMTDIACDDLNASRTCSWFRTAVIDKKNVRANVFAAGKCLSPAQEQKLENISIHLHQAAFGIFSPTPFPTSDFHDQASICFGNR